MKKSQLRQLVLEAIKGYSKYAPGGETKGGTTDDFRNILTKIAKGHPEEDKEAIKEDDEDKFYSKEEVIDYIKNHPPVKYYRIGVGQGVSRDLRDDAEAAIELVQKSGVNKYKLSRYGQVIQFSLPFDEKHGDLVRSMGSLD